MDEIEIKLADNGFVLKYRDPQIVARNRTSDSYEDPCRARVYETAEALTADLAKLLPMMQAHAEEKDDAKEYASALSEAFNQPD